MSSNQSYDTGTIKGRKPAANPPPAVNPGHSAPTTFFLRSEKDIERGVPRGRKASRSSAEVQVESLNTQSSSAMADSSFGVESLADTINSAFVSDSSLSRTQSNSTERSADAGAEASTLARRKRKAGNPVHPSIVAAGQRIISTERPSGSAASPASLRSSESPYRMHLRRGSAASSINLNSQPLTPLRLSPQPESAMPSTPRSGSPKSFRLSDEEGSIMDDTGSQAVQSSSGEEDDAITEESKHSFMPQLVMPSIAVPSRRPFTERGRCMGRLKVMVVGYNGTGKTSLIESIARSCDDIVHLDPAIRNSVNTSLPITETYASTRPYPPWWTDFESRRMLLRRKSVGDGVLERNLCFVDTPGLDEEIQVQQVLSYLNSTMQRTANLEKMADSELINLLSGDGGVQIDAALWLFDPSTVTGASGTDLMPDGPQRFLLEALCRYTNLIPVVGQADKLAADEVDAVKEKVSTFMRSISAEPYAFTHFQRQPDLTKADSPIEPLLVSSALTDDTDEVDASVLMSSQYLEPLMPSELGYLIQQLLDPENIARMRHLSATKFLLWRQQNLGAHIDQQRQALLQSPQFGNTLPSVTSAGSLPEVHSKVLVPHSTSSFYRSVSPSPSDYSALSGDAVGASAHALAHHNNQTQGAEPFRQVRLAKWAQDLQRGLNNERKRYSRMYANPPAEWTSASSEVEKSDNEKALATSHRRPARGRLGGDIAVIDPRDPLGVLAFSQAFRRRSWLALRIASGMGLAGYAAFWVMRNWGEVQEWLGLGQPALLNAPAVPAPTRGLMDLVQDVDLKGFFGWNR